MQAKFLGYSEPLHIKQYVRVFGECLETVDIMQQCGVKKRRISQLQVTQGGVLSASKSMEPVGNPVNSGTASKSIDSPFVSHVGSVPGGLAEGPEAIQSRSQLGL